MRVRTFGVRLAVGLGAALVLVWAANMVNAEVIFDNFNGSFMTDTEVNFGCAVIGPYVPCGAPADEAIRIEIPEVPGVEGFYLTSITLPVCLWTKLYCLPGPYTSFSVSLRSDLGGVPGTPLETRQVTQTSDLVLLSTVTFGGGTLLSTGSRYWVVLCGISNSSHGWANPAPPVNTGRRMYRDGAADTWKNGPNDPAVRVEGIPHGPVPVDNTTWGRVKALY